MSIRLRGKKFQARLTVSGITISESFEYRADAERWERHQKIMLEHGVGLPTALPSPSTAPTLADAIDRYSVEVLPSKRGRSSEEYLLRYWKNSSLGQRRVNAISRQDLVTQRDRLLKAALKPASVRRYLDALSSVLSICTKEWLLLDANPMRQISRPPNAKARERRVSRQELDCIVASARFSPDLQAIILLAIETGMRRSEILSLEWRYIDLAKRVVWLPLTKNGDTRTVPLSLEAVRILSDLPRRPDGKVFSKNGTSLSDAFQRAVRRARKEYEKRCRAQGVTQESLCLDSHLRDIRFHDLRHERISSLVEHGFNLIEVAAISGHRTMQCLKRYSHIQTGHLINKLDQISIA